MQALSDILVAIGQFLVTIYDIISSFISDIVYVVKLTAVFLIEVPQYFAWMPSEAVVLLGTIFSIVVVYKIIGREG